MTQTRIDRKTNMASKFERLLDTRIELIQELQHQVVTAYKYTQETPKSLLSVRLESMTRLYDSFEDNKSELASNSARYTNEERTTFRENNIQISDDFITSKSHILSLLEPTGQHIDNDRPTDTSKSTFKLPSIKIKPFDGKYSEWEEFRDIFKSCFESDQNKLTDCQKLIHLKGLLKDEPLNLIKNLRATNNNFQAAWNILDNRYQNKKKIVNSHLDAILQIPHMSSEKVANLKELLDTTMASLAAIEAIDNRVNDNALLVRILELKLDKESIKHWAEEQKGSTELPTFEQLKKFLILRINILEGIEQSAENNENKQKATAPAKTDVKEKSENIGKRSIECKLCKETFPSASEKHRPWECAKFKSMKTEQRIKLVHENKCRICLFYHPNKQCVSKHKCNVCKESHNTLLHENGEGSSANNGPEQMFNGHVNLNKQSLLATAVISVIGTSGARYLLRALFDPGSTGSFITEKAVQTLKLKKSKANIPICSIDNTSSVTKSKTSFRMKSHHESEFEMNIDAYVVGKISTINPQHTMLQIQEWQHIQGLQLADPTHMTQGHIDILLGVDACAEIWENGCKKGEIGTPIAQKTKLGWILFGSTHSNISTEQIKCHAIACAEDNS